MMACPINTWTIDRRQTFKPCLSSPYVTSHPGQLSLAILPWVSSLRSAKTGGVNRHTARCTSPV